MIPILRILLILRLLLIICLTQNTPLFLEMLWGPACKKIKFQIGVKMKKCFKNLLHQVSQNATTFFPFCCPFLDLILQHLTFACFRRFTVSILSSFDQFEDLLLTSLTVIFNKKKYNADKARN